MLISPPPDDPFLPQPTPEGIERFKALYKARFGIGLDPREALELATRTIQLLYLGLNPPPVSAVGIISGSGWRKHNG